MAAVVRLSASDWAYSRFVRSRLWDVNQAVRALTIPQMQLPHRPWLAGLDEAALRRRLPVLVALNPLNAWIPDFLAPPPTAGPRGLDAELAEVADHPLDAVRYELERAVATHHSARRAAVLDPLVRDPAEARARVVDELRAAHDALLAPVWDRVDALVEADIAHRSVLAARTGLAAVLDDLHPDVSRRDGVVTVDRSGDDDVTLDGRGLSLLPSAFCWPDAVFVNGAGWPPTIAYPARGIAALWAEPPPPAGALADLLGRTRAGLLVDLAEARSTADLSRRHRLAPATVSAHLTALRQAGLLRARREGRFVHYARTALGDALVRG